VATLRLLRSTGHVIAHVRSGRTVSVLEYVKAAAAPALHWVRFASVPGVVLMAGTTPERRPEGPVSNVAKLLVETRDVSPLELNPTQQNVVKEIQNGERVVTRIARTLGISVEGVRVAAGKVLGLLERERDRAAREADGVPFEARPIADLRLKWPAERLLVDLGIETIGELLQWSEADLLRVRQLGVGRIRHIKERLWREGKRTLLGSEPPTESSRGNGPMFLLMPAPLSGTTFHDLASDGIVRTIVSIAIGLMVFWVGRRDSAVRKTSLPVLHAV
jgi:hypothetical protein